MKLRVHCRGVIARIQPAKRRRLVEQTVQRDRVVQQRRFSPRIVAADTGVRQMVDGDAQAGTVIEPIRELETRAEFDNMAQVLPVAFSIGANRGIGRQHPPAAEINIHQETKIAVEGCIRSREPADERPNLPKINLRPVFEIERGTLGTIGNNPCRTRAQ